LIRGHKREISRLKAERDLTIQKLEAEHADALKKTAKQYEAKRVTQLEELTQRLQQQHEAQLEDIEEEHRKRVSQLQQDYGRMQEESDESLQEALSRVASTTQDYEREATRRQALERSMEDLRRQLEVDKKELQKRHAEEMERKRLDWESEKDTMLVVLQKDCNSVFDNRRRSWTLRGNGVPTPRSTGSPQYHPPPLSGQHQHQPPRPSPLSMSPSIFFPEKTTLDTGGTRGTYIASSPSRQSPPSDTGRGGPPSLISQSYSDIDSVLRETEELVQSIL
jgi:hypothetical protein